MRRFFAFFVLAGLCSVAFAQEGRDPSNSSSPSSAPVQVVYVIDSATLTTYNINSQTLQATEVGTLTLPESVYPGIFASQNGKFLYYTAFENYSQQGQKLYVYQTNASGVPNSTPVQTLSVTRLGGLVIDPVSNFIYAEFAGPQGSEDTPYAIERYVVDPATGKISQPVVEAKYSLASSEGGLFCSLSIMNVNSAGTELYDGIPCSNPFGEQAAYNERAITASTGALAPDVQIYSWNNDESESTQSVYFVKNLLFDFVDNYGETNANQVNIYPIQPNVTTPVISCGTDQFAPCGDFIDALVHPSAQYVFLTDPTSTTYIGKVNLNLRQINPESSSIPYEVQAFSPDGTIAYGANDVNGALDIEIYGFNAATGAVTQGGTISVPSDLDSWVAAERY
ncbi:MAG TPA: hypothetical protein VGG14_05315 [Candidatus Sulfotelmatobacter sp.]|jgi:hypothetical protein